MNETKEMCDEWEVFREALLICATDVWHLGGRHVRKDSEQWNEKCKLPVKKKRIVWVLFAEKKKANESLGELLSAHNKENKNLEGSLQCEKNKKNGNIGEGNKRENGNKQK